MGRTATLAALLLIAALIGCALAQAPAPAPSIFDDPCYEVVFENLFDCAGYVNPKNSSTPPLRGTCCQGVGNFLRLSPQCICYLIKTDLSELFGGIDIDRGKALNLPNVCKKKLPIAEFSKCSGNGTSTAVSSKCLEPVAEKLIPCVDYVDPSSNKTKPPANGNVTLPAPENKCLMPLVNKLGSCVDFVDPTVNGTKPPSKGSCCSGLKGFLKDDFNCLCSILNVKPGDYPVSIDRSRILQLPGICNATIPSFKCSSGETLPAAENKCLTPVVSKLGSCIDYVDPANRTSSKPSLKGDCCGGVKTFLNENFDCLCSLITIKPEDYPLPIDRSKVLTLPGSCNATIPSLKCNGTVTSRAPENICLMPAVNNLAQCVDYVDPTSNISDGMPVSPECCSGARNFVKTNPLCICPIISGKTDAYPIPIDRAKALAVVTNCSVDLNLKECLPSGAPDGAPPGNVRASARRSALISSIALFGLAFLSIASAFF